MMMAKIFLKKNIGQRIANGHPWVFGNEIGDEEGSYLPADIVEVFSSNGSFIGKGYINPLSQIRVRLLTYDQQETIDEAFFYHRILKAWRYRQRLGYTENCRLVYAESDGLPALIIDKFNDFFVLQTLALGIDKWKGAIVKALETIFRPKGIYERNDVPVRELEGMPQVSGFLSAPFDTHILIEEHGLKFHVDVAHGLKTGYFLDQQDNRRAIAPIVAGGDVLDAFCFTGTFSLHAAHYGANKVLGLDISPEAIAIARKNAALNGLEGKCRFENANAFDVLKLWMKEGRRYDTVIIDPPAFIKNKGNIEKAITGYKEINLRAMKLLHPGGFLVTACSTNLVSPELFLKTVEMAATDARKTIRQVSWQAQSPDHPILWSVPHTYYLKFLIVEVS